MPEPEETDGRSRLAEQLQPFVELARIDLSPEALAPTRESLNERRRASAAALHSDGVDIDDVSIAAPDGHEVRVRVYRGDTAERPPAVLYCHSGAFVLGNVDTDHWQCVELARGARCVVLSVDYRLAPEHPFPAGLDDAITALRWAVNNASEIDIDGERLAVAGSSAGGCIAACLANLAADGEIQPVIFQLLHQPVLDDRPTGSKGEFLSSPGFDGRAAEAMWDYYVPGARTGRTTPARRVDKSRSVRGFIGCSEVDPLRDEAVAYAVELLTAGTSMGLHVEPGTCHGFDSLLPTWDRARRLVDLYAAELRGAFYG